LERSGANDEHALDAEMAGRDLRGGDGLHGLAQAHLVAEQAAAGAGREQGALRLIIVERHLEQLLELAGADPTRKGRVENLLAAVAIAHLRHETEHVLQTTHLVIEFARLGEESLEAGERVTQKSAGSVEVPARESSESDGTRFAGPET